MKKKQLYCDLDGVLADLESAVKQVLPDWIQDENKNNLSEEQWNKIFTEKGEELFSAILPYQEAFNLVGVMNEVMPDWIVLSALPNPKHGFTLQALVGKSKWVYKNLWNRPAIFCLRSQKCSYAVIGDVLIDDSPENIAEWIKKGGIGILHKGDYKSTIEQLKAIYNL